MSKSKASRLLPRPYSSLSWGACLQVKCAQLQHTQPSNADLFNAVRPVLHELECSISLSL